MAENSTNVKIAMGVWCRALCVLERLETILDKCPSRTTLECDDHRDRDIPTTSVEDNEDEFELQLKALSRVWHPIRKDITAFQTDLYEWFAGREDDDLPTSRVDELAFDLLLATKNLPPKYVGTEHRPRSTPPIPTESTVTGKLGIVRFLENESHGRGAADVGKARFARPFDNDSQDDSTPASKPFHAK